MSIETFLLLGSIFVLKVLWISSEIIYPSRLYDSKCADYGKNCDPHYKNPCCNQNLVCKSTDLSDIFTCTDKAQLGQLCETDKDCSKYILRAECSEKKKCVCQSGSIQTSKITCSPLLNEFCIDNELCDPDNSICFDNLCECDDGYLPYSNYQCLPMLLGTYCRNNTDCEAVKYAKCSKENICVCTANTVQINPSRCILDPDFICGVYSPCKKNANCIGNKCRCKSGFRSGPSHDCVLAQLGMSCMYDGECSNLIGHSICSADKKCVCDRFHYPDKDNLFCLSNVNEACKNDKPCNNDLIVCIDDKCHCHSNYVYDGSKCVPKPE